MAKKYTKLFITKQVQNQAQKWLKDLSKKGRDFTHKAEIGMRLSSEYI
jgi:hypothetical protein